MSNTYTRIQHVHLHPHTYACAYVAYTHKHNAPQIDIYTHVHTHACIHTCMYTYIDASINKYIPIYIYIYIYIYIHTHTYIQYLSVCIFGALGSREDAATYASVATDIQVCMDANMYNLWLHVCMLVCMHAR
jgi:hypothetical protein